MYSSRENFVQLFFVEAVGASAGYLRHTARVTQVHGPLDMFTAPTSTP